MARLEAMAVAAVDDVCIVWRPPSDKLDGCLGFAIERKRLDTNHTDVLPSWVPFADSSQAGMSRPQPSTVWPIQRYVWIDHLAPTGPGLTYRVIPMVGDFTNPVRAPEATWSTWTDEVRCATGTSDGFRMFYTRGIVASQWISKKVNALMAASPGATAKQVITDAISTPGDDLRVSLGGTALDALLAELRTAKADNEVVHAALFEFHDTELIQLLSDLGDHCHLLLANGSHKSGDLDRNKDVPAKFRGTGVHISRRIVTGKALAHNKFVVFSDPDGTPNRVWTGSINWTITGLCTETNNGLLVSDPDLAAGYLAYWQRLKHAGNSTNDGLRNDDKVPYTGTHAVTDAGTSRPVQLTGWLTPVPDVIDLEDAGTLIRAAEHGALFLMFQPGPAKTSLLEPLEELHQKRKFVHGVINSTPTGDKNSATITFFNRGHTTSDDFDVIMPWYLKDPAAPWISENFYDLIMVHSKLVVLDPFGANPVVMTGSHNLGRKASHDNDDNLLIVQGAHGLAQEYATYIRTVFDTYKWRYEKKLADGDTQSTVTKAWAGLKTTDKWQTQAFRRVSTRETAFWLG